MSAFSATQESHDEGKIILCRLEGELTGNDESWEFLNGLRDEATKGHAHIILNLANLSFITTAGIGVIAAACAAARENHRSLVFSDTHGSVLKALKLCGFLGIVPTHDNDEAAFTAIRAE